MIALIHLVAQSDLGGLPDTANNVGGGVRSLTIPAGLIAMCALLLVAMFKAKSWEAALTVAVVVPLVCVVAAGAAPELLNWGFDFGASLAASLRSGG